MQQTKGSGEDSLHEMVVVQPLILDKSADRTLPLLFATILSPHSEPCDGKDRKVNERKSKEAKDFGTCSKLGPQPL